MKCLLVWLLSPAILFGQSIPIGNTGVASVIPYCTSVGYPASPTAGMKVWYKSSSFSPCSATSESSWTDSSGNGLTATLNSPTGTFTCNANQIGAHNALSVSSSPSASFTNNPGGAQTAFAVFKIPTISNGINYTFLGSTAGGRFQYRVQGNGTGTGRVQVNAEGGAPLYSGTHNVTQNQWHMGMFRNGPTNQVQGNLDTVSDITGTWTSFSANPGTNLLFTNGNNGDEFFIGSIAEIIYYAGTELTPTQSLQTECYLIGAYGAFPQ